MTTMPNDEVRVTLGADTHLDTRTAVALDQLGRVLGDEEIPTTRAGYVNRTMTTNHLPALVITAPDELREQLRGLTIPKLVATASRFRPSEQPQAVVAATRYALRELARRY